MLLRLFNQCDRGMAGMVYPDGGSLLDQPLVLLDAFAVISDAKVKVKHAGDGSEPASA